MGSLLLQSTFTSTHKKYTMTAITRQSNLFPDEPHYIPGYKGYCPQANVNMGKTYGTQTHSILTDNSIAKSKRKVLAETNINAARAEGERVKIRTSNQRRATSFGDKKYTNNMVPGYTGYIPKNQEHFGNRYAVGCHRAIYDFEDNKSFYQQNTHQLKNIVSRSPQKAVRSEPAPYVSRKQLQHSVSPYFMETGDPGKTFMSGYTGFIPHARSHYANVYPVMTMKALNEFTEDRSSQKKTANQSIAADTIYSRQNSNQKPSSAPAATDAGSAGAHSIYRMKEGLLPRYTGYLPGHKFRYGVTFGTSARYFHNS